MTHKPSQQQQNAIEFLLAGLTDAEVAARVGKARETVTRWRQQPTFVAAMNRRRHEVFQCATEGLRALAMEAVEVLASTLSSAPSPKLRLEAAVHVLRALRLSDLAPPGGPVSPEDVERERREREAMRRFQDKLSEMIEPPA